MGAIAALIIVAGFGTALLIWFHFEDKKNARTLNARQESARQNACKAIEAMRRQSEKNGNDRLTLDDISNEIQQTRAARRSSGLCSQRMYRSDIQ